MAAVLLSARRQVVWPVCLIAALVVSAGCAERSHRSSPALPAPRVLVVAPVLNLSGSEDLDSLKVTDLVASEFLSFPGVSVVPVNRTLAELASQGKSAVETPADAIELGRALGADATIVTAVTEYDPYDPPVTGLVMQWYETAPQPPGLAFDPVTASRAASDPKPVVPVCDATAPRWQVQRVLNAADEEILEDVRAFADQRGGAESPYGWRQYLKSQELWLRYVSSALIRPILLLEQNSRVAVEPNEASS